MKMGITFIAVGILWIIAGAYAIATGTKAEERDRIFYRTHEITQEKLDRYKNMSEKEREKYHIEMKVYYHVWDIILDKEKTEEK